MLIDPAPPFDIYAKAIVSAPLCPSLTLAMLGGAAVAAGHRVEILDLRLENEPNQVFIDRLLAYKPDVIGFSAFTFSYNTVLRLATTARQLTPHSLILLGGVHAQNLSVETLADTPFDILIHGEGEITLQEILSGRDLSEISGISYRDRSGFVRNPQRNLIANLDELNYPAYELFDLGRYQQKNMLWKSRRIAMVESSRGCPFSCSFCTSPLIFGKQFRAKSPHRMLAEIAHLLDLGFTEIHFQDDGFTTDLQRAKDICRQIVASGRPFHWELYNGIRVDRVDDEFLALAREAGCYRIRFGVESGNQAILDQVGKRMRLEDVKNVFVLTRRNDIETIALFMIGLPGDTLQTITDTIRFAVDLPADFARVSIAIPFPGSAYYDNLFSQGLILSSNWDEYHFHVTGKLFFKHPTLSESEIFSSYKKFYRSFYLRPAYMWVRLLIGLKRGTLFRDMRYFVTKFILE